MRTLLTLTCTLVVACGGSTVDPGTDAGTDSGTGGDTSTDSGGGGGCPAQAPTGGATCTPPNLTCEYGQSANRACNVVATCTAGSWTVQTPGIGCGTKNPVKCPPTYASVPQGTSCSDAYPSDCTYPEGMCTCAPPSGPVALDASASARWFCDVPSDPKCPKPRAKLGTACSTPNLMCDYGACELPDGTAMKCEGGIWKLTDVPCPL